MKFSVHNDPGKHTSGQRFWSGLAGELAKRPDYDAASPEAIFFNISAPLSKILRAKLGGHKVILRLDGIYHEELSARAVDAMDFWPGRVLMRLVWLTFGPAEWGSFLMNLITHNAKLLTKVWFADGIVYQSQFSRDLWRRYIPKKPAIQVLNGGHFDGRGPMAGTGGEIRVVTTYDSWRPAKRLHDLISFVREHNAREPRKIRLTILGYQPDQRPANLTCEDLDWIEKSGQVELVSRFTAYTLEIVALIKRQHLFMTFSFNDNCPNALIEAMSFGLPVVALDSGGIPEIVGGAGEVIPLSKQPEYFCCFDHGFDYPGFDGAEVSARIHKVLDNYGAYCARVEMRFRDELNMNHIAAEYLKILDLEL